MTYLLIAALIVVPLLLAGQMRCLYPRMILRRCRRAGYEVISIKSSPNHYLVRMRRDGVEHQARCRAFGLRLTWKGSPPPGLA